MSTINGIDLLLLMIGLVGWYCFANERAWRKVIQGQQQVAPEPVEAEVPASNVKVVQGFNGRGEPITAGIPVTVGLCIEAGCKLVEEHAGPHMGEHGLWT